MMVKKAKKRRKNAESSSEENDVSEFYDSDGSARSKGSNSNSEDSQVCLFCCNVGNSEVHIHVKQDLYKNAWIC